ncbi:MAG: hypothetical protein QG635_2019 [Bacteroidota bacterium]|nr:hypothetical protein [Bacteroidota bacterium]
MSVVESILKDKELIALPSVATHIINMLKGEDIDVRELTRLIQTDPSLTLKLLRVANSPLYATRKQISSIQQAIMIMGFNKLTNIVLGVSIFSRFWIGSRAGVTEVMDKFWLHSASTGTLAKSITAKLRKNFRENEFIGGLLHQIGKLVMIQYDFDKYLKVIQAIEKYKVEDTLAERKIFGVSHIEVGEKIASVWHLPEELITIIANYQTPSKSDTYQDLVASVGLAGLISEIYGADFYMGDREKINICESEHWKILSEAYEIFKTNGLDILINDIQLDINKSSDFIKAVK